MILIVAGIYATVLWRHAIEDRTAGRLREQVKRFADSGDYASAHALLDEADLRSSEEERRVGEWVQTKLTVAAELRDIRGFEALAETYPEQVLANEVASLFWARIALHSRDWERLEAIKDNWNASNRREESWFFIELSEDLARGRHDAVEQRLKENDFKGNAEAYRLVYQALQESKSPQSVLELLTVAYRAEPENTDIRTFLANAFEALGNAPLAQREYVSAHLIDPANPILKDNLAEFYLRQGQTARAMQTWSGPSNVEPVLDFIWFKAYFWNRVARQETFSAPLATPSPFKDLAQELTALPEQRYFSQKIDRTLKVLPRRNDAIRHHLTWLRILEALRAGDESGALDLLLSESPAASAVSPVVAPALSKLLTFRTLGVLPKDGTSSNRPHHRFLKDLMASTASNTDARFRSFLAGPEALPGLFLSVGWLGTALDFWTPVSEQGEAPGWLLYGIAQAHRYCSGNSRAISFLRENGDHAIEGRLLLAELLLAEGLGDESHPLLEEIITSPCDFGYRAAWLLTMSYLESSNLKETRRVLAIHQNFSESVSGREIQARLSLAENDSQEARAIYQTITDQSVEANVYLAREAYHEEKWEVARSHTQAALTLAPNQPALARNLQLIEQASCDPL